MTETVKPIDLYYWPTPNGWKISIMLEECALPYRVRARRHRRGRAVQAGIPRHLAQQPHARDRRSRRPGRRAGVGVRIRRDPAVSGAQDRSLRRRNPRERIAVSEWLFWQMGGLGPMCGQANHFRVYAAEKIPYAIERYTDEVNRLFGVMNTRLAAQRISRRPPTRSPTSPASAGRGAGSATGRTSPTFPTSQRWLDAVLARPAVQRGITLDVPGRKLHDLSKDEEARKILFGQRAR